MENLPPNPARPNQAAERGGASVPNPGSAQIGSYPAWLSNVRSLLAYHRPDVAPNLLDPNAAFQAYQAGVTPQAFAAQPVLPLQTLPTPSVAPAVPSSARASVPATVGTPDSTLVGWMWGLSGLYVALLVSVGSGAAILDLPAFVLAIVLVARRGPGAGHGWAKLALEAFGCVWVLSFARGGA